MPVTLRIRDAHFVFSLRVDLGPGQAFSTHRFLMPFTKTEQEFLVLRFSSRVNTPSAAQIGCENGERMPPYGSLAHRSR